MSLAAKRKSAKIERDKTSLNLSAFVPRNLQHAGDAQTMIPRLAKDELSVRAIEQSVQSILKGHYKEPADELDFEKFIISLMARAISIARTK
jgi:hypothetical protein